MQTIKRKKFKKELTNTKALVQCAQEFNMVGDETRLKICYLLCKHKELSVGEIADLVGVSISAVSHTLAKLQKVHMVSKRREFRTVYYALNRSPLTHYLKLRLCH